MISPFGSAIARPTCTRSSTVRTAAQDVEIQMPVDLAQQMIGGDVISQSEPIEELF